MQVPKQQPRSKPARRRWRQKMISAVLWLIAAVGLTTLTINVLMVALTAAKTYKADEAPARETALVLGARIYADGSPSPLLAERLDAAVQLYRAGKIHHIILSGHKEDFYDEVKAMRQYLVEQLGSPLPDDLRIEGDDRGARTKASMDSAYQTFHVKRCLVVTNDFHIARSLFLAKAAGIDAVGIRAGTLQDYHWTTFVKNYSREVMARVRAVIDVYIYDTSHWAE